MAQCHQELLSFVACANRPQAHDNSNVSNLGFDSSGERLVTRGFDGRIKVWDGRTGQELPIFRDANLVSTSWAVHPSKSEVAIGSTNGTILRFDLSQGYELPPLRLPPNLMTNAAAAAANGSAVSSVEYSPDGKDVVAALSSGAVCVWELSSQHLAWTHSVPVESPRVFFSADSKQIIVQVQLAAWWLSRDSGAVRNSNQLDAARYWGLHASPDGFSQVTIDTFGEVEFLRPKGEPLRLGTIVTAESALQRQAIFNRDGQFVCTTGARGTARVFRVLTGEVILSLPDPVFSVVFSPDSKRLIVLLADRRVQVWDLEGGAQAMTLRGHLMTVECATFTADGRWIATADRDGVVKVWSGVPGRSSLKAGGWPQNLRCSSDGRIIAAAASYQYLKIWDANSGRLVRTLRARYDRPYGSDLSPDGRWLATASLDPVARLWDVARGTLIGGFLGHTNALRTVRFTPDGRSLATADTAGRVTLWDVASRIPRRSLTNAGSYICCIEFNRASDRAVIAGPNNPPLVWNLNSGQVERVLKETPGAWSARFSPDCKILAVAGLDGVLRVYDPSTWKTNGCHKSRGRGTGWIDFTPDGRRLAQAAADAGVYGYDAGWNQVWDTQDWRELIDLRGPPDAFVGTCFAKDPTRLITANGDRMIYQLEAFPWRTSEYARYHGTTLAERIQTYASEYWKQRMADEQPASSHVEGRGSQSPPINDLFLPPRSPACEPQLIDLSPFYNVRLDAWLHPTSHDELSDFSLAALPTGLITLLGVPFDARGVVVTRAFEPRGGVFQEIWSLLPAEVEGIRIARRVRQIHVLHGACPTNSVPDGTVVGSYVWHFADGTAQEQAIRYGRDLRTWWWLPHKERPNDLEGGRIAWLGDTPRAAASGARIRLYLTTYLNPYPELEVSHIDFVSKVTQAAPFLVAMTVEP